MFPANGKNVKLGKGALFLAMYDDAGNPTGNFDFVGNCSAVSLSSDIQKKELYSSTEHSAGLIASQRTQTAFTVSATCNEFTLENIARFVSGDIVTDGQTLGTSQTKTFENVKPGQYLSLGVLNVTGIAVHRDTDTMVLNTDYAITAAEGMIYIKPTGGIEEGDDVVVTYSNPAITTRQKIQIGTKGSQYAVLRFLADDANTDGNSAKDRMTLWKVDVAPDGDMNFVSDDYGSFNLTMSVMSDAQNHADEPYGIIERV